MIEIYSPLSGTVLALKDVDDPVLAEGIVGAGCAVSPLEQRWHEVCAPVSGRLLRVMPHAFIVFTTVGAGIMVHMGINTVKLHGEGFQVLRQEGESVEAGDVVVRWDSAVAIAAGMPTSVSVVACDLPADFIKFVTKPGGEIHSRQLLYQVHLPHG